MKNLGPSTIVLAHFGSELRRHRNAAGLAQEKLGRECLVSGSQVRMIEHAERIPSSDVAERADRALGTGGALTRLWWDVLWPLMSQEGFPSYFQPFAKLEAEATSLREFHPLAVSGLLQTEDYARAILRTTGPDYTDESSPYLRVNPARTALRSSTAASRAGSVSTASA